METLSFISVIYWNGRSRWLAIRIGLSYLPMASTVRCYFLDNLEVFRFSRLPLAIYEQDVSHPQCVRLLKSLIHIVHDSICACVRIAQVGEDHLKRRHPLPAMSLSNPQRASTNFIERLRKLAWKKTYWLSGHYHFQAWMNLSERNNMKGIVYGKDDHWMKR